MMEVNPQGWRAKQTRARMRHRHGMSREQRAEVREIRRKHALGLDEAQEVAETTPVPEPPAPPGPKAPEHMDWQEMAAELRAAGKFVPPRIGEAKLRIRLQEKRDAEA